MSEEHLSGLHEHSRPGLPRALPPDLVVQIKALAYVRENDLVEGAFRPKGRFIEVPRKPGLGIELDEDAVKKFGVA